MMRFLPTSLRRQRGVSLIELMVAMTLGLIVVGVITAFFSPVNQNRNELENTTRMFDNASFAAELLSDEIRLAGYYAELVPSGATWSTPDICATAVANLGWTVAPLTLPVHLQGLRVSDAAPACITDRRASSDVLTLRRVDINEVAPASVAGNPFLQVSKCTTDTAVLKFSSNSADLNLLTRACDATKLATARRYLVRNYYVRCDAACAAPGGSPTLVRAELNGGVMEVTPMVDGIEAVRFEYGFDTDGNGTPDVYRATINADPATAEGKWSNVVAVRIYVIARAASPSPGYSDTKSFSLGSLGTVGPAGDGYKRHMHTAVVRVVNVAGLRESP